MLLFAAACGGGSAERRTGEEHAERAQEPVELALRAPDGRFVDVGDLRGRPTLLWVFATFDGVCQAAIRPLSRFARAHPEVHVVGVAAQPNAQLLLDAYQSALQPPFVLTYDADERVTEGTSDLGDVDTVPTYVMLDAEGMEVARHTGFAGENRLERLFDTATRGSRRRGGRAPPLLAPEGVSEERGAE
jgi:hypothetical protein